MTTIRQEVDGADIRGANRVNFSNRNLGLRLMRSRNEGSPTPFQAGHISRPALGKEQADHDGNFARCWHHRHERLTGDVLVKCRIVNDQSSLFAADLPVRFRKQGCLKRFLVRHTAGDGLMESVVAHITISRLTAVSSCDLAGPISPARYA